MSLRHGDLENTILPLISIDEFEPKSGTAKEVIVVGFYAKDENPARDLNTFIQRGSVDTLDTEVSPNPDEFGRYLIFIEFDRDPKFDDSFMYLVKDIENLTGKLDWDVKPYLSGDTYKLDDPALQRFLITDKEGYMDKGEFELSTEIEEAFGDSLLAGLTLSEGRAIMRSTKHAVSADVVDFGDVTELSEKHRLKTNGINLSPNMETHALQKMLGESWGVFQLDDGVAVESTNGKLLLLNNLEFHYGS